MQDTSFSIPQSSKSTILPQVVAIVISAGLNYLVASNLGLLMRLNPVSLRPIEGRVKVVELTPSEKTRVPAAAQSEPLPPTPSPVTSSPTPPPFGQSRPVPNQQPFGASSFPNVNPGAALNPFSPKNKSTNSGQSRRRLSPKTKTRPPRNKVFVRRPGRSEAPQTSPVPRSLDSELPPNTGEKLIPNPNVPSLDGSDTNNEQTTPSGSPGSSPTGRPAGTAGKGLERVQQEYEQNIQKLRTALGSSDIIARPIQQLPRRPYPPAVTKSSRCSSKQNGNILVGILIDDQAPAENSTNSRISTSLELGDKLGNVFIGNVLAEADADAQKKHTARLPALKAREKGKKVLYQYRFEFDAKTCVT